MSKTALTTLGVTTPVPFEFASAVDIKLVTVGAEAGSEVISVFGRSNNDGCSSSSESNASRASAPPNVAAPAIFLAESGATVSLIIGVVGTGSP